MTRKELNETLTGIVNQYIANADSLIDPQIRINPATLEIASVSMKDMLAEMEHNIETVEQAAGAQGAEFEDDTDYQVSRNPDFYSVKDLTEPGPDGTLRPDLKAIDEIAGIYLA